MSSPNLLSRLSTLMPALLLAASLTAQAENPSPLQQAQARIETGDVAGAEAIYRPLAAAGEVKAQFNLGLIHDPHHGPKPDAPQAHYWYGLAAAQQLPQAQYRLGMLTLYDAGGMTSYTAPQMQQHHIPSQQARRRGLALITLAAKQGLAEAQTTLAQLYEHGTGVAPDLNQAIRWYRQAAAQNHPPAVGGLAYLYLSGQGVRRDCRRGLAMLNQAAESGDWDSAATLLNLYQRGHHCVAADAGQARYWRQKIEDLQAQRAREAPNNERLYRALRPTP